MNKYIVIVSICLFGLNAIAQNDTLIKGSVIDVVKDFKPVLSEAIKIPVNPNPEKPEVNKTIFSYGAPEILFNVNPTIYTIKPISLGTALLPKIKGNYFKAGFGNYATPLFEAYVNTTRDKNKQAGVFYKHLSANGDNDYNNFSQNTLHGYFKQMSGKNTWSVTGYYHRNRVSLYGFSPNEKPSVDSMKNTFNIFDLKGNYSLASSDTQDVKLNIGAGYYFYNTNFKSNEHDVQVNFNAKKSINDVPVSMPAFIRFNQNNIDSLLYQRVFIGFAPEATLSESDFYLKAGFNAILFNDSSGNNFYFFPKAEAGYYVVPKKLLVNAGIRGDLNPNTLRSITSENPFVRNYQLMNTINRFEFYASVKGQLGYKTNFTITSSSSNITNMLFYGYDSTRFYQTTLYDAGKGSLVKLGFALNHHVNTKLILDLSGTLYNYNLKQLAQPFSRPGFEFRLNTTYNMSDKFIYRMDLLYMGQRNGGIIGKELSVRNLDPFTDISLGVDYRYNKNVSAFLNMNNLTNNRYQHWLNYPVYGLNILFGLTFTF